MADKSKAVFLDRDGTISTEVGYIDNADDFRLYSYSAQVLAVLESMGFKLVVVTNQSGVARGLFPESRVKEINNRMRALLENENIALDGVYYCPHLPEGKIAEFSRECSCRKPDIGMIKSAEEELRLDLKKSIMIGDRMTDIACGRRAGLKTILVRTGYGREEEKLLAECLSGEQPDAIVDTLEDAVEWIKNEGL